MFDQLSYGYLGVALDVDGQTTYYLTGGPSTKTAAKVESKGLICTRLCEHECGG
jgi:hypothetical protein